jgi:hypothetical protein
MEEKKMPKVRSTVRLWSLSSDGAADASPGLPGCWWYENPEKNMLIATQLQTIAKC